MWKYMQYYIEQKADSCKPADNNLKSQIPCTEKDWNRSQDQDMKSYWLYQNFSRLRRNMHFGICW